MRLLVTTIVVFAIGCAPSEELTYHKDIVPLMDRHCAGCHTDGEIAPFALQNYQDTANLKELIKASVLSRSMPPNNVDNSGDCQTFSDARWMSDAEIDTFVRWIDDGAKEGPQVDAPKVEPEVQVLDGEVAARQMPAPYLPTGSAEYPTDDYRCFFLDSVAEEDRFMTGFEMQPDKRAQFHHMLLFAIGSDADEQTAQALEDEDDIPGWQCFGDGGVDDAFLLAVWAPGKAATKYPAGTGVRIPGGHRMVMQVHYNLLNDVQPDQSLLRIETVAEVAKEAVLAPIIHDDLELPPGETSFETGASFPLVGLGVPEVQVHGVFPHMHLLGQSLQLERFRTLSPDEKQCLVSVPKWDFDWQEGNFYKEPLLLSSEDSLRISCTFDTSERDSVTTWGDGTTDEMCLVFAYLTLPEGGPLPF